MALHAKQYNTNYWTSNFKYPHSVKCFNFYRHVLEILNSTLLNNKLLHINNGLYEHC